MEITDNLRKKIEKTEKTQHGNKMKLENETHTVTESNENTERKMLPEDIELRKTKQNMYVERDEFKDVQGINAIGAGTSESAKLSYVKNATVNLTSDCIKKGNTKDFKKSPTLNVVPDDSGSKYSIKCCNSQPERHAPVNGLPADGSSKKTGESKDCSDPEVKQILVPSGVKYSTSLVRNRHQIEFNLLYVERENSDDRIHTSLEESERSKDDKVIVEIHNTESCSPQSQSKDDSEAAVQESIHSSELKTNQKNSRLSCDFTSQSHGSCDEPHALQDALTIDGPEDQSYEGNGTLNSCAVSPELNLRNQFVLKSQTSEKSVPHDDVPGLLPTANPTASEIHIQTSHDDDNFIDLKLKQFDNKRSLQEDKEYCSMDNNRRRNPSRNKRQLPSSNKKEAGFFKCYIIAIINIICCLLFYLMQTFYVKQKKYLCGAWRAIKNKVIQFKVTIKRAYRRQLCPSLCKLTLSSYRRFGRVIEWLKRDVIMNLEYRMSTVILALPDCIPTRAIRTNTSLHEIRNILNDIMYRESRLRDHGFRLATFSMTASNIGDTLKLASHGFFCDTDGKIKCSECEGEYTSPDQELQSAHLLSCSCRHIVGPVGNSIQDTYGSQAPEMLLYGIRRECQIEGVELRDEISVGVQQQDVTTDEHDSHEIEGNSSLLQTQTRSVENIDLQMNTKLPIQEQDGMNEYFTIHQRQPSQYINQEATDNVAMSVVPTEYSPPTSTSLASDDRRDNGTAESRAGATYSSYTSYAHSAPVSNAEIDLQQQSDSSDHAASALQGNLPTPPIDVDKVVCRDELRAISINRRNRNARAYLTNPALSPSTDVPSGNHRNHQQHLSVENAEKASCPSSNLTNSIVLAERNGRLPKLNPMESSTTAPRTLKVETSRSNTDETELAAEIQQQQNKHQKQQKDEKVLGELTKPGQPHRPNQPRESNIFFLKSSTSENLNCSTQAPMTSEHLSSPSYLSAEPKPPDPAYVAPITNLEINGQYGDSNQDSMEITQDNEEDPTSDDVLAPDSIESIQSGTDIPNHPVNGTNMK